MSLRPGKIKRKWGWKGGKRGGLTRTEPLLGRKKGTG